MKLHSHNYTVKMDLQDAEFELDNDGLAVFSDRFNNIGSHTTPSPLNHIKHIKHMKQYT